MLQEFGDIYNRYIYFVFLIYITGKYLQLGSTPLSFRSFSCLHQKQPPHPPKTAQ